MLSIDPQKPPQEVSSPSLTLLTRSLAFAILGPAIPIAIIFLILDWADLTDSTELTVCGLLLFAIVGFWGAWRLKNVWIRGDNFLITKSNQWSKDPLIVPFGEIKDIRQTLLQRNMGDTITIEFDNRTKFGRKIVFLPPRRGADMYSVDGARTPTRLWENPVVDELRAEISRF